MSGIWEDTVVGHKLWPLSAIIQKQSVTDDEAVPQREKVQIPSYLSSVTSKENTYKKSKHESDTMKEEENLRITRRKKRQNCETR